MTTPSSMSDKEMEAGISLLNMMQPNTVAADAELKASSPKGHASSDTKNARHASLLKVVAKRAVDELSLPRIAAEKRVQRRSARLTALSHELTLEELRPHFGRPIADVAKEFGICTTFLKKICRRCGIKRWPHRQIRSLNRTIQMLEQVEVAALNPQEKTKYASQIEELKQKQRAVMEDPDAHGKLERMKKFTTPKSAAALLVATDPVSPTPVDSREHLRPVTTSGVGAENLSALAIAVESVTSGKAAASQTETQANAAALPAPLGVQIPLSTAPVPASLATPLHTAAAIQSRLALKISPSNRKLVLVKSDGTRLRSSSISSQQDLRRA
jgi:hypothetical protein